MSGLRESPAGRAVPGMVSESGHWKNPGLALRADTARSARAIFEAEPFSCGLRPIPANATGSSDRVFAKPAPRRGQPPPCSSPESTDRGTLTLKSDFWLLFLALEKKLLAISLRSRPGETAFDLSRPPRRPVMPTQLKPKESGIRIQRPVRLRSGSP